MKKICASLMMALFINTAMLAQGSITVSSDNKDVMFTLLIDGVQMTDFFETWIQVTNLPKGYHKVTVVFEEDSVADIFKNVFVQDKTDKQFQVVEKTDFKKDVSQSGRNIGEKMKIGVHDESFNYLIDKYQFTSAKKEKFTPTESETYDVSTEKSISTSVLPVSKSQ